MALLRVEGLTVRYSLGRRWLRAVDGVSFTLQQGETLGLVGESGCGKSTMGYALLRILPPNGRIAGGKVLLDGVDLISLGDEEMRRVRWARISMIFQSAMNSLNPVLRVKEFLKEALLVHGRLPEREIEERIRDSFARVGLAARWMNSYPHELSGGMKQRVVIALSLLCDPVLVIADEPTTALDVVVQDQIMARLKSLQAESRFGLIVVSHDIALIAEHCDRLAVMYGGQIIEYGDIRTIFREACHPYTIGLMQATPSMIGPKRRLTSLPGQPPDLVNVPEGCRFAPRCPIAAKICREAEPPGVQLDAAHRSLCHFATGPQVTELRVAGGVR